MKKLLLLLILLFSNSIIFSQSLNQPSQFNNVCDDNNDGIALFLMQEIASEITGPNQNLVVTHHLTQADAANNVNPLPLAYTNVVNPQLIFARVLNTVTNQVQIITYLLSVNPIPIANTLTLTVCDDNNDGFASIDVNGTIASFQQGNPGTVVSFFETLTNANLGVNPLQSPFQNTTPQLQTIYVRIQNPSTGCFVVTTLTVLIVNCNGQAGQPQNLTVCADGPTFACFDLTTNTSSILGTLVAADYTVTYHASQTNATDGVNPLTSPFCPPTSPYTVYSRLTKNSDGTFQVMPFELSSLQYQNATTQLSNIVQCDDNNNGSIIWDLTVVQAQINTTNSLSYYTTLLNAQNMTSPIGNPAAWTTNVQSNLFPIYIREVVIGGCDIIHIVSIQGLANCNAASACSSANSLCSSLGVPFSNTTGVTSSGSANCLGTTPNPTWFYFPISSAGTINLQISQVANTGGNSDVDYILYGPFTNQLTPCSNLSILLNNVVSCSYSAASIENAVIQNAQPGQIYILMVTNFSNQAGQITIVQSNIGQTNSGAIDCSGLRLKAFLDANNNGSQDSGESNFPLGQFHYEKNDNGIVHNITAPSGTYAIYDSNATNSYDVSFSVDAAYTTMYNVAPSAYSNLSVVIGSGLITYNFPVTVVQSYNDLAVTIVPLNAPRPGFTYQNKIVYTNLGNQNVTSGTLTFIKNASVTITSISQSGTTPNANGFSYNFTNLAPFEMRTIIVTMQIPTIPTVNAGQILTNSASIVPLVGDLVPENNSNAVSQIVINAYDPNDKMESHGERILHATFTANDYLYYTIRFENTGTASAINVRINDILDSQLDETTVRMVDASHSYQLDRVSNNLTWRFDNIQLPVSVANTTIGKGYIIFKVKPRPGYAVGDIIPNTAAIYFDFNPAIITNTFVTQFVATLGVNQFENQDFVFYPNPTSDVVTVSLTNPENSITSIKVYDILGKTILTTKVENVSSQIIDLSDVNSGMYFIEVTTDSNLKVVKKIMVK